MNRLTTVSLLSLAGIASHAAAQALPAIAVPGKEYIAEPNINAAGFGTPGQVLQWTGTGAVANGVFLGIPGVALELDAIANQNDNFYNQLRADQADMILSFRHMTPAGHSDVHVPPVPSPRAALWYSESTPNGTGRGVWASQPQVDAPNAPLNVVGCELWGSSTDSNFFSLQGDFFGFGAPVSVWTTVSGGPAPYLPRPVIANAISVLTGFPPLDIDVDALMVNDTFGTPGRFDPGDSIIFSIAPFGPFDGGEIFTLDNVGGIPVANYLVHGGITWDTINNVHALFGYIEATEDIDALEAILPTPGTLGLLGAAGLLASRRRRRD